MKLWIDDIRPMPKGYDVQAFSADEAIEILKTMNITHVAFDHDLGDVKTTDGPIVTWDQHEKTGYDVAKWIEEQAFNDRIDPITYSIHSSNPEGRKKIERTMQKAVEYWNMHSKF